MGTAEAASAALVSVDWKRNSITNNSYSRSVLCGAGHSRALACRGEPAVVSARFQSGLKVSLAAPCGWRPPAAPGGVRASSATLEHHAAAFPQNPRNVSGRDFACDVHGHFPACVRAWIGWVSIRRSTGCSRWATGGPGPENEQVLDWLRQPFPRGARQSRGLRDPPRPQRQGGPDELARLRRRLVPGPAEERQREYAQAFEALPVAIEVETRDGAVGLVHADCPVLFWPRLEESCATATSAPARSASGRVTACAWWIAPACSACARWWPGIRPWLSRCCWATSITSTPRAGRMATSPS